MPVSEPVLAVPSPAPPRILFAADGPEAEARVRNLLGTEGFSADRLTSLKLREIERLVIQDVMTRVSGNISHAARALGLSRSALYRRLERHGL